MHDAKPAPLAGCYVISLRPVGGHAPLRRAVAARGGHLVALSPVRIQRCGGDDVRAALASALDADVVVFSSPVAVAAASALAPLRARDGQHWYGVGTGTLRALERAGVATALAPSRMDSEGLLSLPGLQQLQGRDVGLVTAPGGRGMISATLQARGARLVRADVYARVALTPSTRALARLHALDGPALLALSSGEALESVLAQLPPSALMVLRRSHVVAASPRLTMLAEARGFTRITQATDARPAALVRAMVAALG